MPDGHTIKEIFKFGGWSYSAGLTLSCSSEVIIKTSDHLWGHHKPSYEHRLCFSCIGINFRSLHKIFGCQKNSRWYDASFSCVHRASISGQCGACFNVHRPRYKCIFMRKHWKTTSPFLNQWIPKVIVVLQEYTVYKSLLGTGQSRKNECWEEKHILNVSYPLK